MSIDSCLKNSKEITWPFFQTELFKSDAIENIKERLGKYFENMETNESMGDKNKWMQQMNDVMKTGFQKIMEISSPEFHCRF